MCTRASREGEQPQESTLDGDFFDGPVEGDDQHGDDTEAGSKHRIHHTERLIRIDIRIGAETTPGCLHLRDRAECTALDGLIFQRHRLSAKIFEDFGNRLVEVAYLSGKQRRCVVDCHAENGEEQNVEQQQRLSAAQPHTAQSIDQGVDHRAKENPDSE